MAADYRSLHTRNPWVIRRWSTDDRVELTKGQPIARSPIGSDHSGAVNALDYDRWMKRARYTRHGIPEFWIINPAARPVEVCPARQGDGCASIVCLGPDAVLELELLPGAAIPVAALLG